MRSSSYSASPSSAPYSASAVPFLVRLVKARCRPSCSTSCALVLFLHSAMPSSSGSVMAERRDVLAVVVVPAGEEFLAVANETSRQLPAPPGGPARGVDLLMGHAVVGDEHPGSGVCGYLGGLVSTAELAATTRCPPLTLGAAPAVVELVCPCP